MGEKRRGEQCYLCTEQARENCPRCGRPFCFAHGQRLCRDCAAVATKTWSGTSTMGLPSGRVYRAVVIALILGVIAGAVFLIREPDAWPAASVIAEREAIENIATAIPTQLLGGLLIASPTVEPSPTVESLPDASPTPAETAEQTQTATPSPTSTPAGESFVEYEVEDGDTIYDIALQFGVTMDEILELNDLEDPDDLTVGQVISIPQ